jgi:hypothetical protein
MESAKTVLANVLNGQAGYVVAMRALTGQAGGDDGSRGEVSNKDARDHRKAISEFTRGQVKQHQRILETVEGCITKFEGVVDNWGALVLFVGETAKMTCKTEGDLVLRTMYESGGMRTYELLEVLINSRMLSPLKKQAQTFIKERKAKGVKTSMKRFLAWVATQTIHLPVAFKEFKSFNAIRQRNEETSREYWVRFTQTAKALECFGTKQFTISQASLFNAFINGLLEEVRELVIPRLSAPDGRTGPMCLLNEQGILNAAGRSKMWAAILQVIYTVEAILVAEGKRIRRITHGGSRSRDNSPRGSERKHTGYKSYNQSRSPSPGHHNPGELKAAFGKPNKEGGKPKFPSSARTSRPTTRTAPPTLGAKQVPWGPKGSTAAPHNRRSISPSRGGGPPSATQRCNYCDSHEHFWRNCPKRQTDGVVSAGHDALVKKCQAMEDEERENQIESSSFKAARGKEEGTSRDHSPEKGSSRGGSSTSGESTSERDSQELDTDVESEQG